MQAKESKDGKTLQKLARRGLRTGLSLHFCKRFEGNWAEAELLNRVWPKRAGAPKAEAGMGHTEIFWMACDSIEQLRAEYGPFQTRTEAETEARRLGFGYLLRYEHVIDVNDEIQEVRCIFIELPGAGRKPGIQSFREAVSERKFHTRCASCGEMAVHDEPWRAEVWADIHEFEHTRHRVRLFEQTRVDGLKEIGDWRDRCA
jgi:hypothetical protein